jgi:D-alanyl-lipoteichoic acid acyltransferase DltB (MBOAT superfamily)
LSAEAKVLFNSAAFLFAFLPVALVGYQILGRFGRRAAIGWLGFISLVFYGMWRAEFLILLVGSILMNFACSRLIARPSQADRSKTLWLIAGVSANLTLLAYFKYFFPLLGFLHRTGLVPTDFGTIILPLGISFFTFTQIAYLVDLRQGEAEPQGIFSYTLFVTFFPHLIAGPIFHHKEIMPQFSEQRRYSLQSEDMRVGLSWFVLGLSKKVLIADRISGFADQAFAHPAGLPPAAAWIGVLNYSMQLYFDFSGYSDMAIGLARMFSIRFPLNFNSPYKASNIVDFWARFHMTLTRYITMYLYNPIALSISRRRLAAGKKVSPKASRTLAGFTEMIATPTLIAMFLAGVWHGAGLQFFIFGLLHGFYITAYHAWRIFAPAKPGVPSTSPSRIATCASVALTYLCVIVGQIFFRSNSTHDALVMLQHMAGLGGHLQSTAIDKKALAVLLLFPVVWFFPNTQQIMGQAELYNSKPSQAPHWLLWRPNLAWSVTLGVMGWLVLMYVGTGTSFLYFQF